MSPGPLPAERTWAVAEQAPASVSLVRACRCGCGDEVRANGVARMGGLDGVASWLMVFRGARVWVRVN